MYDTDIRGKNIMDFSKKALLLHKKLAGKIVVSSKLPVKTKERLSTFYTPGVGAVSSAIGKNKELVWKLTGRGNFVAIVTDGTAVLGLGNIGPEAALPVMEGKSVLFSALGKVNAFPLCISAQTSGEIVNFVRAIAPSFGGINLEDIAAPACFEVEEKLILPAEKLGIPVFHDDQDGTAIVVLAALINATKVLGRRLRDLRIVILGAGAAGCATAWLLLGREKWQTSKKVSNLFFEPPEDVILVDSKGIIEEKRDDLTVWKKMLAQVTNKKKIQGGIEQALKEADVVIGLSTGGKLTVQNIHLMNKKPIIFAMANPVPEIMPELAKKAGVALIATGRSDFPNQVNNALVFPGFFRGLLDARATHVTSSMKYAAAQAMAGAIKPNINNILPSVLEKKVHQKLAQAVERAVPRGGRIY